MSDGCLACKLLADDEVEDSLRPEKDLVEEADDGHPHDGRHIHPELRGDHLTGGDQDPLCWQVNQRPWELGEICLWVPCGDNANHHQQSPDRKKRTQNCRDGAGGLRAHLVSHSSY